MMTQSRFSATRWSLVAAAAGPAPARQQALESLCRAYWRPVFLFARRLGLSEPDAEDAVQGFFADLLEKEALGRVETGPERGKFRSWLLAGLKHWLSHSREKAAAQKRGGGTVQVALDAMDPALREAAALSAELEPDRAYDRAWARGLLDRARDRLQQEYAQSGKEALFLSLRPMLAGEKGSRYAALAESLGMSEGALKVAVHRLRDRYRTALREEVADTVGAEADVDAELRELIALL